MKCADELLDNIKDNDNSTVVSDYTDAKELAMMVLNINENNTVDSDINSDVCIGNGYLAKMKDLAKEIIGDDYVRVYTYD